VIGRRIRKVDLTGLLICWTSPELFRSQSFLYHHVERNTVFLTIALPIVCTENSRLENSSFKEYNKIYFDVL